MTRFSWEAAITRYGNAKPGTPQPAINRATKELTDFMGSQDGKTALELLDKNKSGISIVFGTAVDSCRTTFMLSSTGFVKAEVEGGTLYQNRDRGGLLPPSAEEMVRAAVELSGIHPNEILSWLHRQLDIIAECAPLEEIQTTTSTA